MKSGRSWRPWFGIAALTSLLAPGCVYVPYCVPAFQRIGALEADPEWDDVRVFRLEGTAKIVNRTLIMQIAHSKLEEVTLRRIDPSVLNDQSIAGIERGVLCLGMVNTVSSATCRELAVHLYRPGYRTIQLVSGRPLRFSTRKSSLEWIPVADSVESEQAVDFLLHMNRPSHFLVPCETELASGGASPAHRESLLFAAAEYDRIAWFVDDDEPEADAIRERLREKAKRLRKLADRG